MRILILSFIFLCFSYKNIEAQNTLFTPYIASPLEARIGSFYQPAKDKMRLDIGNTIDLSVFDKDSNWNYSIGTDAFILTRLRSEGNLKFPVETADYFFGFNCAAKGIYAGKPVGLRLRLSHISTHLVDGAADKNGVFVDKKPFVFSREFADITAYMQLSSLRLYSGLSWVWSTQPRDIGRFIPQLGFDMSFPLLTGIDCQAGYDMRISTVQSVTLPTHSIRAGIAYINEQKKGTWIGIVSSFGRNIHGMYFTDQDAYIGFGFNVLY
jgi:hypothetical protein